MTLAVIKPPLDRSKARPINWAAYQACGTIVPPRRIADDSRQIAPTQPPRRWIGLLFLLGLVLLIAVPIVLQVTQ